MSKPRTEMPMEARCDVEDVEPLSPLRVVATGFAIVEGHLHAFYTRVDQLTRRVFEPPRPRGPREAVCPLCGHQLGAPERRPPRDMRGRAGQIKRLPEEVLTWRRCGGCGLHQLGYPQENGRAA